MRDTGLWPQRQQPPRRFHLLLFLTSLLAPIAVTVLALLLALGHLVDAALAPAPTGAPAPERFAQPSPTGPATPAAMAPAPAETGVPPGALAPPAETAPGAVPAGPPAAGPLERNGRAEVAGVPVQREPTRPRGQAHGRGPASVAPHLGRAGAGAPATMPAMVLVAVALIGLGAAVNARRARPHAGSLPCARPDPPASWP
jgi:hypothetical protein